MDEITAFMEGQNSELPGIFGEGAEVDKEDGRREGFGVFDP